MDGMENEQPLVSLIVPIYNTSVYLRECLDSVLAQTYGALEVLLIDDASQDDSADIARAYAARDGRFKYMYRENGGLSAARNTGLDAAAGEWIAFLDSDDVLPPRAIETLVTAALSNGTAMAMGAYVECHVSGRWHFNRYVGARAGVWRGEYEVQRYYVTHGQFLCHMWTKLFRRDVFVAYRFPVGKIYEDNFALPHLLSAAGSLAVVDRPVYRYQVRKGSITTQSGIRRQMDGLEARLAYADYLSARCPELTPLAHDVTLSFCCNLLARMEHMGVDKAQQEWAEVTAVMDTIIPQAAQSGLMYKVLCSAYRRDPRLVSRFVLLLFKADGIL